MMKEAVSPEEKLLRLIRGQKKQGAQAKAAKFTFSFNSRKTLMLFFAAACIYLAASLIYPLLGPKKITLPKINRQEFVEPLSQERTDVKPFEFYQQGTSNRQIFTSSGAQENVNAASAVNTDIAKDINLVGILAGENPQAIIEDKKTLKTYYVTKGQFIGEMQVEDIQEGKIIINYKGRKYELYL